MHYQSPVGDRETYMSRSALLKAGVICTIISALCCFTPILVIVLAAVGLSSIVAWLDFILLPALAFFVLLTVYALISRNSSTDNN